MNAPAWPAYTGENAHCPKCGQPDAMTGYCAGGLQAQAWRVCPSIEGEHLHRRCSRCGYAWKEGWLP